MQRAVTELNPYVILCGSAQEAQQEAASSSSAHPPFEAMSAHDVIVGVPASTSAP
jgi:hypothetical protein